MTSFLKDGRSRPVAFWLVCVALLVFAMIVVGGTTRLTGSGLSITEWKPVSGVLPPLSEGAWLKNFALYQATPQYRQVNAGMTLAQFKTIFWWEWSHRFLARLFGLALVAPLVVFLVRRTMPLRLIVRCGGVLALAALEPIVGWWMVESGLENRVSVAPERLATHLGLGLLIYSALIWTAMEAWSGQARTRDSRTGAWPIASLVFAAAVFFQCLLGALVAGNQAGLIDNDWPLMDGYLVPPDYAKATLWATLAHSQAAVQFNHRVFAYLVVIASVGVAGAGLNSSVLMGQSRALALAIGVAAVLQALLGVATLVLRVPLPLALIHQAGAAILLALAVSLAWRVRRP
jgi:cytochrome c oxidase assembly protein subunit 15